MKREIKFRVWDIKADNPQGPGLKGVMLCDEWLKGHSKELCYCLKNNSNDLFLMQYTGLKDKNGKEIYEGDIVEGDIYFCDIKERYIVQWITRKEDDIIPNRWAFVFMDEIQDPCFLDDREVEIIGNQFENPELL